MSQGPLAGIRVVDLTRVLAGPFSTMLLADLGAEVIKVETPAGDQIRGQGGMRDGFSWYFAGFNRNKRSVKLNMRTAEGMAVVKELVATADVLVENFRPGVLAKMGLTDEVLKALKPDLVVCSISGYGQTGPYKDRPSFDFIAQAMSGFMSSTGYPDREPLRAGLPISDLVAGLYGALAVAATLRRREVTGKGERIDVALVDSILSFSSYFAANYLATGNEMGRNGNDHPVVAPYGVFRARDGDVAIAPSNDQIYDRLIDALELREALAGPDFATNAARMKNRPQVNAIIDAKIGTNTRDHWVDVLNAAGVPCGRVLTYPEVFEDPQTKAREMLCEVEHPGRGPVRMLGFPMKLTEAPCEMRAPAPELGADTDTVLAALGYDPERIASLRESGVI
ncbi:CaiB/BaiF CoA transferase family protein [Acuticoccus yangtzensis]|uniref:CaiB/BaiF CoA transferase family protein n=1 Tax=Acuticoccus yangtzensis TaxID=1443441 RepID=UPI0009495313|nr:CoA transferase [Acuticoccus yangtzensis]ORE90930.1 CoA-transferase [Stappia sp. 22II-S9-Z10]